MLPGVLFTGIRHPYQAPVLAIYSAYSLLNDLLYKDEVMKLFLSILTLAAVMASGACSVSPRTTADDLILASMANPARSDADRERDGRSHPEVALSLLGIKPGDTVADIFAGGGYYSQLIAGVTGPEGEVILHNNTPYSKWVMKQLQEQYMDNPVPGIRVLISEVDDPQLEPNSLDAALMVKSYHDLYYFNPERGWGETDVELFMGKLQVALKPGARLVVIDHAAFPATGKESVQELHRIDEAFVRQEIEKLGLTFLTDSDVLRNPNDDKSKMVFDKTVRGKTDRFLMVFTK
jgi:predicted methyltransferase